MQTKTRLDRPRNIAGYEIYSINRWVGRRPQFDALNRAEYYIWRACRDRFDHTVVGRLDCEAHKAKARWCLKEARRLREDEDDPFATYGPTRLGGNT